MSDWNTTTPIETPNDEPEETGLTPEQKAERKRERQNTKLTCLQLAVSIGTEPDEVITAAAKFYAFITGTKVRAKKEG